MKNKTFQSHFLMAALFCLVFSVKTMAQTKQYYGIKAGMTISKFYGQDASNSTTKLGLAAGAYWHYPLVKEVLFVQPEVLFIQKGGQQSLGSAGNYKFSLHYLQVPVLVGLELGPVHLSAGPYAAFLLKSTTKLNGSGLGAGGSYRKTDFGLLGGLSYKFENINAGVRYDMGLSRVSNAEVLKNSAIQVFIGCDIQ
jgi:Outer membrane protein beta-barrel domain